MFVCVCVCVCVCVYVCVCTCVCVCVHVLIVTVFLIEGPLTLKMKKPAVDLKDNIVAWS